MKDCFKISPVINWLWITISQGWVWVYSEFMYIKIQYIEYNIVTLGT